jgi:uncharacterized protein (DUF2236 family)
VPLRTIRSKATIDSVIERARADPVLGFYGPHSMMWRINREAVLLGAGPAALLLQIAHPLVAEGVAHHSTFEQDPIARLRGTLITTMDLIFGDGRTAEAAVRRLNSVHRDVRGEVLDPHAKALADRYRALDPDLLLWVQVTLIRTSVEAYSRWVRPLSEPEREQFWQEARSVGVRLGIPLSLSPADWPALTDYWRRMLSDDGPIHPTETALRLAPLILRPPLPVLPGPLVDLLGMPGMALVPAPLRNEFGIEWTAANESVANALSAAVRAWTSVVPGPPRWMPQARAAYRRIGPPGGSRLRPPSTRRVAPVT